MQESEDTRLLTLQQPMVNDYSDQKPTEGNNDQRGLIEDHAREADSKTASNISNQRFFEAKET